MNNYETVFIVTPVLSDAQVQEVADKFQGVITENRCRRSLTNSRVSSPKTAVRL